LRTVLGDGSGSTSSQWRNGVEVPCTICRATRTRTAYVVDGHRIARCTGCGHLFVSPRPPMNDVMAIYGEQYFENPAFTTTDHDAYFGYMDYLRDRDHIQARLGGVLDRVARRERPGRLLDVGCGLGLFVEVAALGGWDAWGVDPNEHAIKWTREHITEQVSYGTLEDIEGEEGFDCITMFDVIEHVEDPRAELEHVWRLLRPNGLLVVVTPNAGAVVPRLLGARWLEMKRAPEHLHFFSARGLSRILDGAGFTPIEWHSIGKITTLRIVLADLRFYSEAIFGGVERGLERLGLADRVVDIDPGTKLCMYARKTGHPSPVGSMPERPDPPIHRVRGRDSRRHRRSFDEQQRRYWEGKERFLDPRLPGPTAFAVPKLDWVAHHVAIDAGTSVLDVGAGNGTITWHLGERAGLAVGVDRSTNLIERSPYRPMVQCDAVLLPFPDKSFDVVVESNFLHHADDPVAVLTEMARVARGPLVLIEPNRWHPPMAAFMTLNRSEWRGLRFDERSVERLAHAAELKVVASSVQGAVYPNVTPAWLLPALRRFDRPGRLGGYVTAVLAADPA
jgi:2-polyprenyl-3-methyl-5-hydroxy-6-metoxy-1,4-benzoquinol methylase